jgi:feruloyl esterase
MKNNHQTHQAHEGSGSGKRRLHALGSLTLASLLAAGCGGDGDSPANSAEQVSCESLAGTTLAGGNVRSAEAVPAGDYTPPGQPGPVSGLPAFCRVTVTMKPSTDSNIDVEVWMPRQNWNGRFLGNGSGGGGGGILYFSGLVEGLRRGFASAITDLGTAPDPNLAVDHRLLQDRTPDIDLSGLLHRRPAGAVNRSALSR